MGGRREGRKKEETKGWNEGRRKKKGRERGGEGGEEEGKEMDKLGSRQDGQRKSADKINFEKKCVCKGKSLFLLFFTFIGKDNQLFRQ